MTFIPENVINQAIRAIITTRDFCGNEQQAAYDVAIEHGFKTMQDRDKVWRIASFRANAEWNAHQKAAGVSPKYTW